MIDEAARRAKDEPAHADVHRSYFAELCIMLLGESEQEVYQQLSEQLPADPDRTPIPVDERGVPTDLGAGGTGSAHCPARPCVLCVGYSAVPSQTEQRHLTSWELCRRGDVCTATIDWEKVHGR